MEEILEKIKNEIEAIEKEQENLKILTESSEKIKAEKGKLEEEQATFSDKESGFYKDLAEKITLKSDEFIHANNKRMDKQNEIDKLISKKKEEILNELAAKKKYIDENRNIDIENIDLVALKEEKAKIEEELKLNDTPREDFDKLSDADKQAVRKAKERYLINKNRLNEINPQIQLMETLEGKTQKDMFMSIENLEKQVEENFNSDNFDKLSSLFEKDEPKLEPEIKPESESEPKQEEKQEQKPEPKSEPEPKQEPKSEAKQEPKQELKSEAKQEPKQELKSEAKQEPKQELKSEPKQEPKSEEKQEPKSEQKPEKLKITLVPDADKIYMEDRKYIHYAINSRKQKELYEKYKINEIFDINRKSAKNIDYSLLSRLDKVNPELAKAYLSVIRGDKENGALDQLNQSLIIEYKFENQDKRLSALRNLKAKRLARNANKLGIASLEGISEIGLFDKIKSKLSKTKLFKNKEKTEQLEEGKETIAQRDKQKAIDLIKEDRKLREENSKPEEQKGYENLVNADYLKSIEPLYKNEFEKRVKVNNSNNEIEQNANKAMQEQEQQRGEDVKQILEEHEETI